MKHVGLAAVFMLQNQAVDNCDIRHNKAFYGGGINVF